MKSQSLDKEKMQVDYTAAAVPASVKNFRPEVFRDGERYYCVLGAGTENAIYAEGDTIEKALQEWDSAYQHKASK